MKTPALAYTLLYVIRFPATKQMALTLIIIAFVKESIFCFVKAGDLFLNLTVAIYSSI